MTKLTSSFDSAAWQDRFRRGLLQLVTFIESELFPRARSGPASFYDSNGSLLPGFATEMDLLADFAADLAEVSE